MNRLQLKVCGMGQPENVAGLMELAPDFVGFIFYKKSARYMPDLDQNILKEIPNNMKKTGVFVNEKIETVSDLVEKFGLDYAQLHGDENLDYCQRLKSKGVKIIKVFRVMDSFPKGIDKYQEVADYFLFDTQTPKYGGAGHHFDWNILKSYDLDIPYLLSGGVKLEDVEEIKEMKLRGLVGIDVNSKFEIEPGLKDLKMIGELKKQL